MGASGKAVRHPRTVYRSKAEESADIYRLFKSPTRRPLEEEFAALRRARQSLLTVAPQAVERARKAMEERGLEWPWGPEVPGPAEGGNCTRRPPEHPTPAQDSQR